MNVAKQLFGSKKFVGAIAGIVLDVIVAFLPEGILTADLKVNLIFVITTLTAVFVGGQAIADHGKEKAKIEAAAANGGGSSE